MTKIDFSKMTSKEKSKLKKQAAHRILAGYGFTRHSWNIATTYGFSFDSFRGTSKVYKELQELLTKEDIKFSVGAGSMTSTISVSNRKDNLEKFIKLGEKVWKNVLKLYLPMINELEKIQKKIDSRPLKSKDRFNYIVSRKCFADYHRKNLIENEIVENYEEEIRVFTKLLEVQNDLEAVKNAYKENHKKFISNGYSPMLAIKLEEEYERLTGEKLS